MTDAQRLVALFFSCYIKFKVLLCQKSEPTTPDVMKAGKTKAVIFDMDGVLTDSEPLINMAAVQMFSELGLRVNPEDFVPFIGAGEERYIGGVAEKYKFPIDIKLAKKRVYEIYLQLVPNHLKAFPGAVEFVRECKQNGLKISLTSSADIIKIRANLEKIGLPIPYWDVVVSAEDVEKKKPAPDLFLKVMQKLGVEPAECVVIEDSISGIQAALAAGAQCIAVAHTFPEEKLKIAHLVKEKISDIRLDDL
jgi:HAD superfamily hydrolase (TIGR01509 family)